MKYNFNKKRYNEKQFIAVAVTMFLMGMLAWSLIVEVKRVNCGLIA
jgi:hypothetical protein